MNNIKMRVIKNDNGEKDLVASVSIDEVFDNINSYGDIERDIKNKLINAVADQIYLEIFDKVMSDINMKSIINAVTLQLIDSIKSGALNR